MQSPLEQLLVQRRIQLGKPTLPKPSLKKFRLGKPEMQPKIKPLASRLHKPSMLF